MAAISTFNNDTLKKDLKDKILNPLITQHNQVVLDLEEVKASSGDHATSLTALTTSVEDQGTSLTAVTTSVEDHETRLTSLELSGGDGSVDLTPILERLDVVEEGSLDHETRITSLENGGSGAPTKWYVLPLGGQSNMTGFGEIVPEITPINPRLMQLGYLSSDKTLSQTWTAQRWNVCPESTVFGEAFDKYRPYEDCNLKLIPSTYCLDNHHNIFGIIKYAGSGGRKREGGMVGTGHYLAEMLLNYIPKDYGILIVDGSRGSTGFGDENALGTYDAAKMHASDTARRWGVNTPFGDQFYDRVKHALELNTENKLLPVVWFLGESDDHAQDHYERYKAYVKWFRDTLDTDGLGTRVPTGNKHDFRWLNFSSTKIHFEEDLSGKAYLEREEMDNIGIWSYIRPNYDNYAYLMDDPEFIKGANKESQILSVRIDIDENGDFFETVAEELSDAGLLSVASSQPDWHFSSSVLIHRQPAFIANVMSSYGKCLEKGPVPSKWTRKVRGLRGTVSTDNVVFEYDKNPSKSFNSKEGLLVHHDYPNSSKFADASVSYSEGSVATAEDATYGTVANFTGVAAEAHTFAMSKGESSYTASFLVKIALEDRMSNYSLFSAVEDTNTTLKVTGKHGSLGAYLQHNSGQAAGNKRTFLFNKSLYGGWEGQFEDWQHIVFSYDKDLKVTDVYCNGCLLESVKTEGLVLEDYYLGRDGSLNFKGQLANFRLYEKALSKEDVAALELIDKGLAPESTSAPVVEKAEGPSKWYILPMGGQSNLMGFAENVFDPTPGVNPRLMQLGMHTSYKGLSNTFANQRNNVSPESSGYGDKFDELRPYEDCNLKLIPAVPALDCHNNSFYYQYYAGRGGVSRPGGLIGSGMYVAQMLLPSIPEDYGILIVNSTCGSVNFGDHAANGTYDSSTLLASEEARRTGVDTPVGNMFYDRVKYALELNPENRLLPILWENGEFEEDAVVHMTQLKSFIKWFRDKLATDGLSERVPTGNAVDFRWVSLGTSKLFNYFSGLDKNYLDLEHDYKGSPISHTRAIFDNYAYLMDDPEFTQDAQGESQVVFLSMDIDRDGTFFETVKQELIDMGNLESAATSLPDAHFSSAVVAFKHPAYIVNAISNYCKAVNAPSLGKWERPVKGRVGKVTTDNVVYQYERPIASSFNPTNDLLLHLNPSHSIEHTAPSVTLTKGSVATAEDAVYGTVLNFTGVDAEAHTLALNNGLNDYTMSFMVKWDGSARGEQRMLVSGSDSTDKTLRIESRNYAPLISPCIQEGDDASSSVNFAVNKSILGAWEGQYDDWQHLTVTYNKLLNHVTIYVNGCLVETITHATESNLNSLFLGRATAAGSPFKGQLASVRAYSKCLSLEEVNFIRFIDKNLKGAEPSASVTGLEKEVATLKQAILDLQTQVSGLTRWHLEL